MRDYSGPQLSLAKQIQKKQKTRTRAGSTNAFFAIIPEETGLRRPNSTNHANCDPNTQTKPPRKRRQPGPTPNNETAAKTRPGKPGRLAFFSDWIGPSLASLAFPTFQPAG